MRGRAGRLLALVFICGALGAATADGPSYRLSIEADAAARDALSAAGWDIAGLDLRRGRVELVTGADGLRRLIELGYRPTVLERRDGPRPLAQGSSASRGTDAPLPDARYHDPAEVESFLQTVAADHPSITRLEAIGTTSGGRTIWALLISDNAAVDEDELAVLFNGAHHAREVMTPEVVMDTIDYLTDNYGTDARVTSIIDGYEVWCVPIVNPDGVARVHEVDDNWRKNTRDNDGNGVIDGQDGVDLNRNYEWGWGYQCLGSSGTPSSGTYRGPSEGSEAESQALLALSRRERPVFDIDYHAYGEDVFYALSCDPSFSPTLSTISGPDQSVSRVIAEDYAARIVQADGGLGFSAAPYGYRVDGTGRDQQYRESGTISFVTEVNTGAEGGFRPDYGVWRDATVQGQRPAWLWLIERAGGPAVGGHVREAGSGVPLAAEVSLAEMRLPDGRRLTTDPLTGRFHLIVVPGAYTLTVSAPGYEPQTVPVTVAAGPFVPLEIELQPAGALLVDSQDFEDAASAAAWTAGFPGDTATAGKWTWGEPEGTHDGDILSGLTFGNPLLDATPGSGVRAFVTGNPPAASFTSADVDGGVTTLLSPVYDLSGLYGVRLRWWRWMRADPADPFDRFDVEVSTDEGQSWVLVDRLAQSSSTADASPAWTPRELLLDEFVVPGPTTRLRFRVFDEGADNVVEGGLDDLSLRGFSLVSQGEVSRVRLRESAGTVLDWIGVPGGAGVVYDVVRGELSALSAGPGGVELGALTCIENDSADTSSADHPDPELPAPGSGRFYLVRFELGLSRGDWGRGSAGGVRAGSGGC